jgi:hypothetical protein
VRALVGTAAEFLKLVREMLVIPLELWLFAAENAGAAVLAVWRRALLPLILLAWELAVAAYRAAERHVTPAGAVAAVAGAALLALAASQWLDLSSVSVGTDAYAPGVQSVAPPPEVAAERSGDAHAWIMLPIAAAGLVVLFAALAGRPRAARLLAPAGIAVIVIALAVDAPQGLDEGDAALSYQGAVAHLLEGFWVEIACGAVLVACGLLLPGYLRASASQPESGPRRARPQAREGSRFGLPGQPRRLGGQTRRAQGSHG